MTSLRRSSGLVAFSSLSLVAWALALAQDPAPSQPPTPAQGKVEVEKKMELPPEFASQPPRAEFNIEVKPLPPVAIPDDPPPHEGALFDLPLTVHPPDVIIVEVLEALPGRPITGERLVRPDGTISLGFYGDLHVRGLTLEQIKVKVALHLRRYVTDEVLGLIVYRNIQGEEEAEMPLPNTGRNPFDLGPGEPKPAEKKAEPEVKPPASKEARPSARLRGVPGPRSTLVRRRLQVPSPATPPAPQVVPPQVEGQKPEPAVVPEPPNGAFIPADAVRVEVIQPADSQRIFADIVSFNTHVYYVQGDVGVPGRLAWTGGETILDALNYAGGLVPSAEPTDIHLHRPARGDKPAKDYKVDYEAIRKGVATANLQMFPGDRLVIGRNPIVTKTAALDRAVSPLNSMLNSMLQYSFTARSLAVMNNPTSGTSGSTGDIKIRLNGQDAVAGSAPAMPMTQAEREALFREWAEFFWSISRVGGDTMVDEKAFKEALMKKLTPATATAPK